VLARIQELPSDLRREMNRRRALADQRAALRRAGERLVSASDPGTTGALGPWHHEVRRATDALASIAAERRTVAEAEARDLARVAWWIRPVVVLRGLASRIVLQHDRRSAARALDAAHEALGRAATPGNGSRAAAIPSGTAAEGSREAAGRTRREIHGFARAVWDQLRSHLLPKAPALAAMAVGWWVANTYTDSRFRSVLRSVGIGSGGTHVVSGSTYRAMTFWLPLLAAALCAYLGDRVWERVMGRKE
jgi:hypothetical protein